MSIRRVAIAAFAVACLWGVAPASAPVAAPVATQAAANPADAEFVSMMIPHHYQAVVMSRMAPTRSTNQALRALASRIVVEQNLENYTMQAWQRWNGLPVTNAEQAYHHLLQDPEMLEMMGMATPAELSTLSASTGTAFDRLYLRLMIDHHEGAIDMIVDVITNGSDEILQQWATEMLTVQYTQMFRMEQLLAQMT